MKLRSNTLQAKSLTINVTEAESGRLLPQLTSESKGSVQSPFHNEAMKKLRTLTINPPQSITPNQAFLQRYSVSPQASQLKSLSTLNTSFTGEKPRSPPPGNFYLPSAKNYIPSKKTKFYEDGESHQYKTKKHQNQSETIGSTMSPKQKIHVSQFLFDPAKTKSGLDFQTAKEYFQSYQVSSTTYSRPGTTAYTESGTSCTTNTRNTVSDFSSIFKTKLNVAPQESNDAKLKQIESLGTFKRQLKPEPGFFKAKESSKAVLENVSSRREKFWFRLQNNICTKNKLNIKQNQKKKMINKKTQTNEEIIMENKDKMMICVETQGQFGNQVQYCFVKKEVEKDNVDNGAKAGTKAEIEFNMKLNEIQRRMRLDSQYRFLYLLNGTSIFELQMIPRNENVLILSRDKELGSIENIIQNELVTDFYEYGSKKDIVIYEKSHVESKMISIIETKHQMEKKYNEVLRVFDTEGEKQLDSDQLASLVKSTRDGNVKEVTKTVHKIFQNKDIETISEGNERPSMESSQYDKEGNVDNSEDKSYVDRVITGESEPKRNIKLQEYLENTEPLMEDERLSMFKEILGYYKRMRKITIDPQEPDQKFINAAESDHDDEELNQPETVENVSKHLVKLLKRLENPIKKLDYLEIKKELERLRAEKSSYFSEPEEEIQIMQSEDKVLNPEDEEEKDEKKNYIHENIKALGTKKGDIHKLHRVNRELFIQNIPKYITDKKLTRRELHVVYILYKALCEVTSQRYKRYNTEDGIDYHSFRNGIYQVFLQSEEVAEKVFYRIDRNFSGFLNWDEFLNAMVIIRARSLRDKIDLFIRIADEDQNGYLSKEEIFNLTKICLSKFIKDKEDGFLDSLCEYFTRLIFTSVGVSLDEEIPLKAIKEAIISKSAESDLLAMFCGADI